MFFAAFFIHELLLEDDWRPIITSVSGLLLAGTTASQNHSNVNESGRKFLIRAQILKCIMRSAEAAGEGLFILVLL